MYPVHVQFHNTNHRLVLGQDPVHMLHIKTRYCNLASFNLESDQYSGPTHSFPAFPLCVGAQQQQQRHTSHQQKNLYKSTSRPLLVFFQFFPGRLFLMPNSYDLTSLLERTTYSFHVSSAHLWQQQWQRQWHHQLQQPERQLCS